MSGCPAALGELSRRVPAVSRRLGRAHAALYRTTQGRTLARWFGASILVLETVGRRTGLPRAVPLVYLRDGDDLVVVPANAGAHRPPGWWLNLRDADGAVAHLGTESRPVWPREATGAERARLWARMAEVSPLDHYQRLTTRSFPVVLLERAPTAEQRGIKR